MDDFYVTLPSSVENPQTKNTSSEYVTRLPQVLNLERDKWVVALSDIIYPYSFDNVGQPLSYWIHFKDDPPVHVTIPSDQYPTIEAIVNKLNGSGHARLKRSAVEPQLDSGMAQESIATKLARIQKQKEADQQNLLGSRLIVGSQGNIDVVRDVNAQGKEGSQTRIDLNRGVQEGAAADAAAAQQRINVVKANLAKKQNVQSGEQPVVGAGQQGAGQQGAQVVTGQQGSSIQKKVKAVQAEASQDGASQPSGAQGGVQGGAQLPGVQPSGTKPSGAQPPGARPPGAKPSGAQPPGAQLPAAGAKPSGAQPPAAGTKPSGAQPPGAKPSGAQPPAGVRSSGAQPPAGVRSSGAQPPGAKPSGAQPPGAKPSGAQPPSAGAKPSGAQPPSAGAKPSGAQPPGAKPSGAQVVTGQQGAQVVTGQQGAQVVTGQQGAQVVTGQQGAQVVTGQQGAQVVTDQQGSSVQKKVKAVQAGASQDAESQDGAQVVTGQQGSSVQKKVKAVQAGASQDAESQDGATQQGSSVKQKVKQVQEGAKEDKSSIRDRVVQIKQESQDYIIKKTFDVRTKNSQDAQMWLDYIDAKTLVFEKSDADSQYEEDKKSLAKFRTFSTESRSGEFLTFEKVDEKIAVAFKQPDKILFIEFDKPCAYFLGFTDTIVRTSSTARKKVDFFGNVSALYLYCDCVEPNLIGNELAPLLSIIPCSGRHGEMVRHSITQPRYYPIMHSNIDSIKIQLLSEFAEPIDFHWGTTIVVLHFKRVQ